jgi:DegV family protein with EDD domain
VASNGQVTNGVVQIVTDTTCMLPPDVSEAVRQHVRWVRTSVEFKNESWVEGTFALNDFYNRLTQGRDLPHTSQPSPVEFLEAYQAGAAQGPVLAILLSSHLSSTYSTGVALSREFGDAQVAVFDSGFMSTALGHLVAEAAEMALQGATRDEIIAQLEWRKANTLLIFTLDTLTYLRRGGRVNLLQAGLAELLDLKPILALHEGKMVPVGRIRSRRRSLDTIIAKAEAHGRLFNSPVWVAAMHGRAPDEAATLLSTLQQRLPVERSFISEVPASLALHGGPGVVGVMVTPGRR